MEFVVIADFTAYPGGVKRFFKAGGTVTDLSSEDVAIYIAHGLAKPVKQEKKPRETERSEG